MKIKRIAQITAAAVLAACMASCLFGCGPTGTKEVSLTPIIDDDALVTAGTLTVGVDSTTAPFGAESNGSLVGIDVDVAAAIATEMGLELQVIDIKGENPNTLLEDDKIDVVMSSAAPQAASTATTTTSTVTAIGPYIDNGPVLFGKVSTPDSVDISNIKGTKVGTLHGTTAATNAATYAGTENIEYYDTYPDLFDALEAGDVQFAAVDAVAGSYMTLSGDYADVVYAASLNDAKSAYIGVLTSNAKLGEALTSAIDAIESNGVLEVILSKWVGADNVEYVMPGFQIAATEKAAKDEAQQQPAADGADATDAAQSPDAADDGGAADAPEAQEGDTATTE